jgi:FMN-dependent NADH-azoreductase
MFDHQETYLQSFFNFIGVKDISFVRAEGVNQGGELAAQRVRNALTEAAALRVA